MKKIKSLFEIIISYIFLVLAVVVFVWTPILGFEVENNTKNTIEIINEDKPLLEAVGDLLDLKDNQSVAVDSITKFGEKVDLSIKTNGLTTSKDTVNGKELTEVLEDKFSNANLFSLNNLSMLQALFMGWFLAFFFFAIGIIFKLNNEVRKDKEKGEE